MLVGDGVANNDIVETAEYIPVDERVEERVSTTSAKLMLEYVVLVVKLMKLFSSLVGSLWVALL